MKGSERHSYGNTVNASWIGSFNMQKSINWVSLVLKFLHNVGALLTTELVFVVKEGEWECEAADNVPQQDDITSCGVLMIVILLKVYFNENYRTVTVSPYQVITYRMQILKFLCEGITGLESAFWDDDPAKARAIDMFDRNWLEEKSRSYQQFKHDLNLINTNKHEFLVEFGPKPKRRTITLVVNEQEYSFQQEDLGMTFYQDSKLTQTQLTALLAKRSETSYAEVNRCSV